MSKHKLLLADDSITIQKLVNLIFADQGIEVIIVGDGDAALEKFAEIRPDIVLADVNMPGLNGYQFCEHIRKNEETKDLPVILLVGSFEPFNVDEADRVGANAFLTKPFSSIRELIDQVSELLDSSALEDIDDPEIKTPETNDIDALYEESFVETIEMPRNEMSDLEFTDAGMDDEIIEKTYADTRLESQPAAPLGYDDGKDGEPIGVRPFTENEKKEDSSVVSVAAASHQSVIDHIIPDNAASERAILNVTATSKADDIANGETLSFDKLSDKTSEPSYQFDEVDLLELPAVADEKTLKISPAESTVNVEGNPQIVSLSPEQIETIVQKVVEKLAEKY